MKDKKLALKKIPPHLNENLLLDAQDGLLKFGNLSICYLMRKLKCTEQVAKDIIIYLKAA